MTPSGGRRRLRAVRDATSTIPIVMVAVDYDPIALGYITGLPRPGGQITGLFLQQYCGHFLSERVNKKGHYWLNGSV